MSPLHPDGWYYAKDGQQHGPIALVTLQQLLASGQVHWTTLVWCEGMPEWQPASQVAGLVANPAQPVDPQLGYAPPTLNPLNYQAATLSMVYAGFWWRVLATIIDQLILGVAGACLGGIAGGVIGLSMGATREMELVAQLAGNLIGVILGWLYSALLESGEKQATLGKMACGLIVTDQNGQRISFGRATGRHFAKYLSAIILLIGYIMVAFTQRKQGLHDILASTLVYKK